MNKASFVSRSLRRFMSPWLAALAVCVLLAPSAANATPYVVKLKQQGNNVIATGGGSIDLTGLTYQNSFSDSGASLWPSDGFINLGSPSSDNLYFGLTGPTNFGNGDNTGASTASGDFSAVMGNPLYWGVPGLYVPYGYTSDTALSGSATWDHATFASLGVTPGTYVWTWGSGADQSFTLDIVAPAAAVPEPAALGIFGFGVLLIGAFVGLRRQVA